MHTYKYQYQKKKKTRVQTPNAGLLVCSVWFYISTLYISTTPNSELQAFTQKRIFILVSPPPARSSMLSPYFPLQNFLLKGVKSLQMLCTFPPSPTPFTLRKAKQPMTLRDLTYLRPEFRPASCLFPKPIWSSA